MDGLATASKAHMHVTGEMIEYVVIMTGSRRIYISPF